MVPGRNEGCEPKKPGLSRASLSFLELGMFAEALERLFLASNELAFLEHFVDATGIHVEIGCDSVLEFPLPMPGPNVHGIFKREFRGRAAGVTLHNTPLLKRPTKLDKRARMRMIARVNTTFRKAS